MKPIKNERGMVSMVVALAIVAIGALVILQISSAFVGNQQQDRSARLKGKTHLLLLNIAQRIKRGHDLAAFRPDCTGFGTTLNVKSLPGHTGASPKLACVKDSTEICTTNPEITGDNTPICASLANGKIDWQIDAKDTGGAVSFGAHSSSTPIYDITIKTTSISIPARTDPIWKDCNGNTCVRISLCPPGSGTCNDSEIVGAQTIMLSGN